VNPVESATTIRDTISSILLGPVRYLVPITGYLLVYPLILHQFGLDVVGIWSLLFGFSTMMTASDVGFSQLLARDGRLDGKRETIAANLRASRWLFAVVGAALGAISLLASALLSQAAPYSAVGLMVSIALVIVGTVAQLIARMDSAVLSANDDNAYAMALATVASALPFVGGFIGTLLAIPLEGLGFGLCSAGLVMWFAAARRLQTRHGFNYRHADRTPARKIPQRVLRMMREGWHFYSISLAFVVRIPLMRLLVVTALGLAAAAIFELALRATQSLREAITGGFAVLLPTFASHLSRRDSESVVQLSRLAISIVVPATALGLGALIAFRQELLAVWLVDVPAGLTEAVVILAAWNLLTTWNVPFWFALQAIGHERTTALTVWAHVLLIGAAVPFAYFFSVTFVGILSYWAVTAVVTQIAIYSQAQRVLGLPAAVFRYPSVLFAVGASCAFFACAWTISSQEVIWRFFVIATLSAMVVAAAINGAWRPAKFLLATREPRRGGS
jgi:O-antigen/teichoic acid export membrane protein